MVWHHITRFIRDSLAHFSICDAWFQWLPDLLTFPFSLRLSWKEMNNVWIILTNCRPSSSAKSSFIQDHLQSSLRNMHSLCMAAASCSDNLFVRNRLTINEWRRINTNVNRIISSEAWLFRCLTKQFNQAQTSFETSLKRFTKSEVYNDLLYQWFMFKFVDEENCIRQYLTFPNKIVKNTFTQIAFTALNLFRQTLGSYPQAQCRV